MASRMWLTSCASRASSSLPVAEIGSSSTPLLTAFTSADRREIFRVTLCVNSSMIVMNAANAKPRTTICAVKYRLPSEMSHTAT